MRLLAVFTTFCCLIGCGRREWPQVVSELDVQRYSGEWYELARFPNSFERGYTAVRTRYAPRSDGQIDVRNIGLRPNGRPGEIEGVAWQPDPSQPAKLRVRFFWPLHAAYWVIGLDPDYRWAVVGHPSRDYLWFLCRTPQADAATWAAMEAVAKEQGFDLSRLERTKQPAP